MSNPWCSYTRVAFNCLIKQLIHYVSMIFLVESFCIQIYFICTNNNSAFMCAHHVFCTNRVSVSIFMTSVWHTKLNKFIDVRIRFLFTGLPQCWNYWWQLTNCRFQCCTMTVLVLFGSDCVCTIQNQLCQLTSHYSGNSFFQWLHIRPIFCQCPSHVMLRFLFHDKDTIWKHLFIVFGKLCSIEFHNRVLLVLQFVEKHDKGSGHNFPDRSLYEILKDVVLHW